MFLLRLHPGVLLLVLLCLVPPAPAGPPAAAVRYRVEQVIRLETTTVKPPQRLQAPPAADEVTAAEARVRFLLEQALQQGEPARGTWRFLDVELEDLRQEPEGKRAGEGVKALAVGLAKMRQLEGREFRGALAELPVFPLGESEPAWLTAWLRWAQAGVFAGVNRDPVERSAGEKQGGELTRSYEVRWLRSDFRQEPCHVQEAQWAVPPQPAAGSLPADLEARGVEARTHFAATSLEWVARDDPVLVYAERTGVRETSWRLEDVERPELRGTVFRLRLSVTVEVERVR